MMQYASVERSFNTESYGNCLPNLGECRRRPTAHASAGSPRSPPCLQAMTIFGTSWKKQNVGDCSGRGA